MELARRPQDRALLGTYYEGKTSAHFTSQTLPKADIHCQWGLVLAGAADFARPAKDISLSQNAALMATGLIWTRWCFVIKPQNMFLASVNFLLFCVGTTQVSRVLSYQKSLKGTDGVVDAIKGEGKDLEKAAEKAEAKAEAKLSK